jgi:hypothetical protein
MVRAVDGFWLIRRAKRGRREASERDAANTLPGNRTAISVRFVCGVGVFGFGHNLPSLVRLKERSDDTVN